MAGYEGEQKKSLLATLSKRREDVDAAANTYENTPEDSKADAAAHLESIQFSKNAPSADEWLKKIGVDEELEAPPILEERGDRPAHAPLEAPGQDGEQRLKELADSLKKMQEELQAQRKALGDDRKEVREREEKLKAREAELAAERAQQLEQENLRRNYPQPQWLDNIAGTFNVALVGNAGVGKSLLINKIRHLQPEAESWAPVGVNETTMAPKAYPFPDEPRVRLWDLPGAGTELFPRETYIATMGLRYFDKVLVLTAERFTQTEVELREELQAYNVPYFMVRTKIDIDVWNNQQDNRLAQDATVKVIREDLIERGIARPYLVSARDLDQYDFQTLLKDAFPGIRRQLDSNAVAFVPGGWNDAWSLPVVYSPTVSGLQGRWRGHDGTRYTVQGLQVHVSTYCGCAEVLLAEDAEGRVWWMSGWWINLEGVIQAQKTNELRWSPYNLHHRPMIWWSAQGQQPHQWNSCWG